MVLKTARARLQAFNQGTREKFKAEEIAGFTSKWRPYWSLLLICQGGTFTVSSASSAQDETTNPVSYRDWSDNSRPWHYLVFVLNPKSGGRTSLPCHDQPRLRAVGWICVYGVCSDEGWNDHLHLYLAIA